ncbi:sugar ABC transporter permease [Arthrobacter sp. StoSoilB22]|uniref:carbohydrate ABC transporter permease n=1 Tax=Arthrobacter sp. StoSoilB22 TaxID=2830996 RepID=UPI001CC811DA|nr:sugar ABC transporter permease [Arthrobacter sp. StoSoilB22]BCW63012.1 sugar ABC transporter permease [Arthrobacter sp. StoSoilB22]
MSTISGTLRPKSKRDKGGGGRTAAIFLTPFFVLFMLCMIGPVVYSVVLSLFSEQKSGLGFGGAPQTTFVGITNYLQVLSSESFLQGFGRIGLYVVMYIPVMIGGAIVLALLLDALAARAKRLFQLLLFLPHAVPGVIAALIWTYLYTPGVSPVVQALENGGISLNFFSSELVLPAMVNIAVWQWTGYNVIIIYTALQAIPQEVLEAAVVDGAGQIRAAISIKLPLVLPALGVIVLFTSIGALQLFTEPSILYKAASSVTPGYVPNMWAYDAAFNRLDLNQAAAASIIIAALAAVVSYFVTRFNSRNVNA